ncbi:LamG-like jellyroll fold domain-containing protein [Phytomonospora sp. NPDC050363]|uniref:LamG-like jellyroll fold domain-containing protein n=1 Tax=Phytomonospora sp. NPDC050363 TaxID=3155642 RepID=UPI0033EBA213
MIFRARMPMRAALLPALAVVAAIAVVVGPVEQASAADPACPEPVLTAEFPSAKSERGAQALAAVCGFSVEVLDLATESTKVMAEPDGSFSMSSTGDVSRAEKDDAWRPIDTTLVQGSDGKFRPAVSTADVEFSAGGAATFAVMRGSGADFSLSWPTALPQGVASGDSVTYPEVLPGVDLVARATATGFSHVLVVKTPDAAANPAVREVDYRIGGSATLREFGNGLVIDGPEGVLASAPSAHVWDSNLGDSAPQTRGLATEEPGTSALESESSPSGPGDAATVAPADVVLSEESLTIVPEPGVLDSGVFPVYIDPTYEKSPMKWIPVNDNQPNTSWTSGSAFPRETARIGSDWDSPGSIWRAHFQFDVTSLKGKRITGTPVVDVYATHSGWCGGQNVEIWQTSSIDNSTTTWNGMKESWLHGDPLQTKAFKANDACTDPQESNHSVLYTASGIKTHVQRHADSNYSWITFGFRVPSESDKQWAKLKPSDVTLKATYENRPSNPVAIESVPGGKCQMGITGPPSGTTAGPASTSPGPWINNRTPTLVGKGTDPDNLKVEFDLDGPTSPAVKVISATSNTAVNWKTPVLTDGSYSWRARASDNAQSTSWTKPCYFKLDSVRPTQPTVQRTSGPPVGGEPVSLTLGSTDAASGVASFAYGVNEEVARTSVAAVSSAVSITFTPQTGWSVVYIWAVDKAGNYSARVTYDFMLGEIIAAEPAGAWRFSGDLLDDSGNRNDLVADATGTTWTADRAGHGSAAIGLDGTGCARSSAIVRTDAAYSVAGWARVANKNSYHTLVSQSGVERGAFSLHHTDTANADRWRFSLAQTDNGTTEFESLTSSVAVGVGEWHHIAATVDPVAKSMKMYLDGVVVAEKTFTFSLWNAGNDFLIGCVGGASTVWNQMAGAVDHVGVWQGTLTQDEIRRAMSELPAAAVADWQLEKSGVDSSGRGNDLAIPETAAWTHDQFSRTDSAVVFDGSACLAPSSAVLRTDESFTVSLWAKVDASAPTGAATVVSQSGGIQSAFAVQRGADGNWRLTSTSADTSGATSVSLASLTPAKTGEWQHVLATFDASARELALWVDGALQATAAAPSTSWNAAAPVQLGCQRLSGGSTTMPFTGAMSDVEIWRGKLSTAQIADVHGGVAAVRDEAIWMLNGGTFDPSGPDGLADSSGNGRNLTVTGSYTWTDDRFGYPEFALALDLSANACANSTGPVVRTDSSFTIATWVNLDGVTGDHTAVAQVGASGSAFTLGLHDGAWSFGVSAGDSATATWSHATAPTSAPETAPAAQTWTHLAGAFNAATRTITIYVNGDAVGSAEAPTTSWNASGPTHVGCSGLDGSGAPISPLGGAVDEVRVWTSLVDPNRISELGNQRP